MDVDNLIDMANRIGEFFDSLPDREESVDSIADHIRRFLEPGMRRAILDALDREDARAMIAPIVREALVKHRTGLMPRALVV